MSRAGVREKYNLQIVTPRLKLVNNSITKLQEIITDSFMFKFIMFIETKLYTLYYERVDNNMHFLITLRLNLPIILLGSGVKFYQCVTHLQFSIFSYVIF